MLNAATAHDRAAQLDTPMTKSTAAQRVVIVNGSPQILELLETAFAAGDYQVLFVESNEHAYTHIKQAQPDLVILCMHLDELDGFHLLSMLKLDVDTRAIPVLTYTTEYEGGPCEDEAAAVSDAENLPLKHAVRMN